MSEQSNNKRINFYNIYSTNIFNEKYAIWKSVLKTELYLDLFEKSFIFELHLADVVDLFRLDENSDQAGNFKNINEYNEFLTKELNDYDKEPPSELYFGGYGLEVCEKEVFTYIKNFDSQKGYMTVKVFDPENMQEMPMYYFLLRNSNNFDDPLKGLYVPEKQSDILAILFNHNVERFIKKYEYNKSFSTGNYFDVTNYMMERIICENKGLNLNAINDCLENISFVGDFGIRIYLALLINSFLEELESKKITSQCSSCKRVMLYRQNKKYCSEKCKIKQKNQRYYKIHAQRIHK